MCVSVCESVVECVCVLARQLPRHAVHNAFIRLAMRPCCTNVLFRNYALHKAATTATAATAITTTTTANCDYMLHKNAFRGSSCHKANCTQCSPGTSALPLLLLCCLTVTKLMTSQYYVDVFMVTLTHTHIYIEHAFALCFLQRTDERQIYG